MDLKTPVGPLPLGAWVVIVGAGLGVNMYLRRNPGAPPVEVEAGPEPGVGLGGNWIPTQPGGGGSTEEVSKPKTNEEWGAAATRWLIAKNYDPNTADSAVRKYLISGQLTVAEYAMIGIALAGLGPPPYPLGEPAPPPNNPNNPPPSPPSGGSGQVRDVLISITSPTSVSISWLPPATGATTYTYRVISAGISGKVHMKQWNDTTTAHTISIPGVNFGSFTTVYIWAGNSTEPVVKNQLIF